jgi:hypothetical protein
MVNVSKYFKWLTLLSSTSTEQCTTPASTDSQGLASACCLDSTQQAGKLNGQCVIEIHSDLIYFDILHVASKNKTKQNKTTGNVTNTSTHTWR